MQGGRCAVALCCFASSCRWLVKKHKHLKATDILARIYQGDQERAEAEVADIQAVLRSGDGIPGSPSGPLHKLKVFFTWRFLHRYNCGPYSARITYHRKKVSLLFSRLPPNARKRISRAQCGSLVPKPYHEGPARAGQGGMVVRGKVWGRD